MFTTVQDTACLLSDYCIKTCASSTYCQCQPVSGISGRRHLRSANRGHLDFPRVKLLRTEDVHLHTPALRIGTHFLLTLETVVFLFHLLGTTSKPFSSLSTRLAYAARLGFFYKTHYINSLLLLLLLSLFLPFIAQLHFDNS